MINLFRGNPPLLAIGLVFFLLLPGTSSFAAGVNDPEAIPHVGLRARESYVSYLYATDYKAFAIGPGGAWAWQEGLASAEEAARKAIDFCQRYTQQRCITYALNDALVFDSQQWSTLWRPYLSTLQAEKAKPGNKRGQRFYDLLFKTDTGQKLRLSDYRGKVVFLHFWGSWCPSCMFEFPSLQRLQQKIKQQMGQQVELIILQAREPFSVSRRWANKNGFGDMPLYDSGADADDNTDFRLANGNLIPDRAIARVFPSSYVIDKNGIVVFGHHGAVNDWLEYINFIQDLVTESGPQVLSKKD
ncbi:MAG TPA: TlpA family protein disulfide reductase [Gammaproteobacteria bacterium]|nr:TlpA family protein disulfide reductase [Gammaproteobacteria bacterium]